ncbi:MAG: OmpH family outer membrane protein [Rikenellaceae bacterium]|nr:OmpH family outer membrane protein [Rikenellaceae bacterium]
MKKAIKLLLACLFIVSAANVSAQKFARIDYERVIATMPEMDSVDLKYQKAAQDYQDLLENIQVELNNKRYDYEKNSATMSAAVKQLKEKEMQDLNTRLQEFYQSAQQELAKVEAELIEPLVARAKEAITKLCKANGYVVVFQNEQVVYLDEEAVKDVTEEIRTALGCVERPTQTEQAGL